jgi:hypothetical protein
VNPRFLVALMALMAQPLTGRSDLLQIYITLHEVDDHKATTLLD